MPDREQICLLCGPTGSLDRVFPVVPGRELGVVMAAGRQFPGRVPGRSWSGVYPFFISKCVKPGIRPGTRPGNREPNRTDREFWFDRELPGQYPPHRPGVWTGRAFPRSKLFKKSCRSGVPGFGYAV